MTDDKRVLAGIFAAAVTPLRADGTPDLEGIPDFLSFLAQRGCHGALLLGTTGEGTSFDPSERRAIWEAGLRVREEHPEFVLLAGTGTPSLTETIGLNQDVFALGYDGVVVLPPFYYRSAPEKGLIEWYAQVIETSVPNDKWLLGYHIPAVSGVGLSGGLLTALDKKFPGRFGGLKDSSGDLGHAQTLATALGSKSVLVGNDKLLAPALKSGAKGSITSLANLVSPLLRQIWEAHAQGENMDEVQERVNAARQVLDSLPPAPAFLKAVLHEQHHLPLWRVRPPFLDFDEAQVVAAARALETALG